MNFWSSWIHLPNIRMVGEYLHVLFGVMLGIKPRVSGMLVSVLASFCHLDTNKTPGKGGVSVEELPPSNWFVGKYLSYFLMLCQDIMIKATNKMKCLIWGSAFRKVRGHDHHGREHCSRQADRALEHWLGASSWSTIMRHWKWNGHLKPQSSPPVTCLLP